MSAPLVSAIVSTYNSAKFIEGKIEDLLNQTISDQLEIIIVNSGSRQNEDQLIQKYLGLPNIKYIRTAERETIYKAWNRGIKTAVGEFICNANTDDRLRKDAFEVMINVLRQHPETGLVYPDQYLSSIPNETFDQVDKSSNTVYRFPDFDYIKQLDRCLISSQPMWRASLHFKDNIWFDDKIEVCGDYDFTMKVAQKYNLIHLKEYLGVFYLSPSKTNKSFKEADRGMVEMQEISIPYIKEFISSSDNELLGSLEKEFSSILSIPIPLFYIIKRFRLKLYPALKETVYFHSIEFIYYFSIICNLKYGEKSKAENLAKRFLRYKSSVRIKRIILTI